MTLQELLQSRMHKGAALGGAGIGIERVERPQMQNLASVKGIGIAHPGLDARDRELARSGGSRRAGQRRPARPDLSRGKIGRAPCRERRWPYVSMRVVAG